MKIIKQRLFLKNERSKTLSKEIILSFTFKISGLLANFLLVPITINYLSEENYGIWLTLTSFISWFTFFDAGLGNGLRNKFTEARAEKNEFLVQAYVSSAYFTIALISIILILTFLIINPFIDWSVFFNTSNDKHLGLLMPIVFSFFSIQLVLKLITTIYTADQKPSVVNLTQFLTQVFNLCFVWILTQTPQDSLLIYGLIFSLTPVLILLIFNIYGFRNRYKNYRPILKLWKVKYLKGITGLGLQFFILQIAAIVLFSTDNIIISKLFSPEEVVPYNLSYKYFSICIIGFSVIVTPFWSSFTDAYSKDELNWIKKAIKNLVKFWFLIPVILFFMILLADYFYKIWIGDKIVISNYLNYAMAFFVLITTFNTIFVFFINGVGKIRIQLISAIVSVIINIPLSVFFAQTLKFGIVGVILSTCVCTLYLSILLPIQYHKIINKKARGIWNK